MTDWEIMAEALREPGKSTVKWTATSSRVGSIERGRCFVEDVLWKINISELYPPKLGKNPKPGV